MLSRIFQRMWRPRCAPTAPGKRARRGRRRAPTFLVLEGRRLPSITINIDYSYDTNHFFDTPGKRYLMQTAADVVASALAGDRLAAIVPSRGDGWTARFPDPATGADQTIA